jgi:hypothetical protein
MVKKGRGYERPTSYRTLNFPAQIFHGTVFPICIVLKCHTFGAFSPILFYFPWFKYTSSCLISMITTEKIFYLCLVATYLVDNQ